MNVDYWYKRAFVITGGDPLYRDYVHDVFIKLDGKDSHYNNSYISMAIYSRWIDEKRKKKECSIVDSTPTQDHDPIDLSQYGFDELENEIVKALNEGYKPKDIALICEVNTGYIWKVIRGLKTKMNVSR